MEKEPTIADVLKAVQAQETRFDQRIDEVLEATNKGFSGMQEQFNGLQGQFTGLRGGFTGMKGQIDDLKKDVTEIKADMVTKDYLDEKLGHSDGKLNRLVNVLE